MRVLAAAFEGPTSARRALEALRHRYGLSPRDASIAPLGDEDRPRPGRTVLAGHFDDAVVPGVRAILAQFGGVVVSDVDERWTTSPPARPPSAD